MVSTPPPSNLEDRAWTWLSARPRAAVPHAQRGTDPLTSMRALLSALGSPEQGLRIIHTAGSKGKGSTALYIETLLRALGHHTLTFTSPHLEHWTERIRVDGQPISRDTGTRAVLAVRDTATQAHLDPRFFDALFAAALLIARDRPGCWCIIEAGVGGRADATNVVQPRLSIITGIEREHTDLLGDRLVDIAAEKAGIIKPQAPAIVAELPADLDEVIEAAADRAGTRLYRMRADSGANRTDQVSWSCHGDTLRLATAGGLIQFPYHHAARVMAANAALAVAALYQLGITSREALQRAARGLDATPLPGRLETLSTLPWLMVDSAHTEASANTLAETIDHLSPARLILIVSLSRGKSVIEVCAPLLARADRVIATCADANWSLSAVDLQTSLQYYFPEQAIEYADRPEDALSMATREAHDRVLILAAGSAYLAGAIRNLTRPQHSQSND